MLHHNLKKLCAKEWVELRMWRWSAWCQKWVHV